jgi:probable O-glycosylation ligase (exosortase A-associated)
MKQLIFMVAMTLAGTVGVFIVEPFWGVFVYHFFAVLRPQFLWEWSLPEGINWSRYVAVATLAGLVGYKLGLLSFPILEKDENQVPFKMTAAHWCVAGFALWMVVCYYVCPYYYEGWTDMVMGEYVKIFTMFYCSSFFIKRLNQLWVLYVVTGVTLGYIAYEMNYLYLVNNYLSIWWRGYAGLDNNGAGLMLAMGVPICLFIWEGFRRWYRWAFLAFIPLIVHAVLMSYSRGAMLSLLVVCPIWLLRSRQKVRLGLVYAAVILLVPLLAGKEIQARFFSIEQSEADASANSRRDSWQAARRIADDHPIFGAGIRCGSLLSFQYGADMAGRTIHSQYFQIAADNGWVGLGLYVIMILGCWGNLWRVRRLLKGRTDDDSRRARAIASGVEGAMLVFMVGATFLSLEVFELPYLMLLFMAQLPLVRGVEILNETPAAAPESVAPPPAWEDIYFPGFPAPRSQPAQRVP